MFFELQVIIVTGGTLGPDRDKKTGRTETWTMSENNWEIVTTAVLPVPLYYSAALTINNKVYLFGNASTLPKFLLLLDFRRGFIPRQYSLYSNEPNPGLRQWPVHLGRSSIANET